MPGIGQEILTHRILTAPDLLTAFVEGAVVKLDGRVIFTDEVFGWTPKALRTDHASIEVSVHTRFDGNNFAADLLTMRRFFDDTLAHLGRESLLTSAEKRRHYAVVNARRLSHADAITGIVRDAHRHSLSYLWLGLSPGGLHCDYFNNILLQLHGRKRVMIFPPAVSNDISTEHHVPLPDSTTLFARANIDAAPWLTELPCHHVELGPGDAVAIPSGAYHSAQAITADSVSLNAFLTPRAGKKYLSPHARKEDAWPWFVTNAVIALSGFAYRHLGRPLVRTGHYEVM